MQSTKRVALSVQTTNNNSHLVSTTNDLSEVLEWAAKRYEQEILWNHKLFTPISWFCHFHDFVKQNHEKLIMSAISCRIAAAWPNRDTVSCCKQKHDFVNTVVKFKSNLRFFLEQWPIKHDLVGEAHHIMCRSHEHARVATSWFS